MSRPTDHSGGRRCGRMSPAPTTMPAQGEQGDEGEEDQECGHGSKSALIDIRTRATSCRRSLISCHTVWHGGRDAHQVRRHHRHPRRPAVRARRRLGRASASTAPTRACPATTASWCRRSAPCPPSGGYSLNVDHRLDRARGADLVVVPAYGDLETRSEAVLELLRETVDRRRAGHERVLGRVHPRRGRPARRPRLHHALDAHRRAGRPASRRRASIRTCCSSATARS